MQGVNSLRHHVLSYTCLGIWIGLLGFTYVALFARFVLRTSWSTLTLQVASLHVWAVAQLALLVLVVCIVCGVWSASKMIVTTYDVVVW